MNTDKQCFDKVKRNLTSFTSKYEKELSQNSIYPLDNEVIKLISDINLREEDDDFAIYRYQKNIKKIWKLLIQKSIICLRYFDTREPFQEKNKKIPYAYGVNELSDYFKKYSDFEEVLYGGAKYYRDHVIHVFRVWILGICKLLEDGCKYLDYIEVEKGYEVNALEKVSIWTIISLTHDLGYPLEKALKIFDRTKDMMTFFINNPKANMDISFSGVQNSMNDYVLRFISSKMWEVNTENHKIEINSDINIENNKNKKFVTRLQPKYYFKFQKSLEHNEHGVISSLIIYKLLLFFLESDYSINEDYMFCYEDTRQFYIRREILRSIASHTCHDIYQMDIFKFSFLLIICDDAQEWGRKSISELYVNKGNKYSFGSIDLDLQGDVSNSCLFRDNQELNDTSQLKILLRNFYKQSETYRSVFRDGQDTVKRNFNFTRQWGIIWSDSDGNISYIVKLDVSKDEQTKLTIKRTDEAKISTSDVLLSSFNKFLEDIGGDGFVLETDKKSAVFYLK